MLTLCNKKPAKLSTTTIAKIEHAITPNMLSVPSVSAKTNCGTTPKAPKKIRIIKIIVQDQEIINAILIKIGAHVGKTETLFFLFKLNNSLFEFEYSANSLILS
jgi:hypothetical protein